VLLLVGVIAVLVVTNLATNLLPDRWYVPVCLAGTVVLVSVGVAGGLDRDDLGLARGTLLPGLAWALALILLVAGTYGVAAHVPRLEAAFADRRFREAPGSEIAWRLGVAIPLGTVLLEETAFRGVLLGAARDEMSTTWAVATTAALFGLWHVLPAGQMRSSNETLGAVVGEGRRGHLLAVVGTVVFTALGGVVFALLLLWSGSILAPMGLHWALNGMGVAVAWWLGMRVSRESDAQPAPRRDERMS